MRMFIGIKPDKITIGNFEEKVMKMRKFPVPVKWVKLHNIHLTMKFIGEVNGMKEREVISSFKRIKAGRSFEIITGVLGSFRNRGSIRIIFAGIEKNDELNLLFKRIEDTLHSAEIRKESREFMPHFTLGRSKKNFRYPKLDDFIGNYNNHDKTRFKPESILLFRSDLFSTGPVYTVLDELRFK